MDYKDIVADIIVYSIKQVELAEFDLNITREEEFQGEIFALNRLLRHVEMLLGNTNNHENLTKCMQLVHDKMGEYNDTKGDEYLD